MTDIVAAFVAAARQVAGVDDRVAARLADRLRQEFGGQHVRVLPREPVTVERIDAKLRQGLPVRAIAADMGCSRSTIYRHLQPKSRRTPAAR